MNARKNDNAQLITLREAFCNSVSPTPPTGYWLFIPIDDKTTLETKCYFDNGSENEDEDIVKGARFRTSLDVDTIADCVNWADRLAGKRDDNARLEIFLYYCDYDAFPEKLGAPPPPPVEEWTRSADLKWYDQLGPEDLSRRCKREGCPRGVIQFSSFCRPHHFEMIRKKPCPFDH